MLSHHDRAALDRIREQLEADDPAFTRSFRTTAHRQRSAPGRRQAAYAVAIILAVLFCFVALFAGAGAFALLFSLAAWLLACAATRQQRP